MTHAVEVRIRNDVSDIGIVRDTLDNLAREFGIPVSALTPMQGALDEIMSNVMKYSWDDGVQHELLVRVTLQPDRLNLEIFDDGREFDPMTAPSPIPAPKRQRPRSGGRGIHMVKQLVDHFAYERVDGRNHITLSKICKIDTVIRIGDK